MNELASGVVALMCLLLPFLNAVHVGDHRRSDDATRASRVERRPVNTDARTEVIKDHELVLGAGDQAVITEEGRTVTITRAPTESRRAD